MAHLRLRHLGYAFTVEAILLTAACGGGSGSSFTHVRATGNNCATGPIGAPAAGYATI